MCERCKNPNITNVNTYTLTKGTSSRKIVLCDACAALTGATYKLAGGKATEAKPSSSDSTTAESEPKTVASTSTTAPRRRN